MRKRTILHRRIINLREMFNTLDFVYSWRRTFDPNISHFAIQILKSAFPLFLFYLIPGMNWMTFQ